jgi:hypothetical protein
VTLGSVSDTSGNALVAPNTAGFTGHEGPWIETDPPNSIVVDFGLAYTAAPLSVTTPSTQQPAPSGFTIVPGTYFDISTATSFSSADGFTVTLPYDPAHVTGAESGLKLWHWESGAWVNITTSVDTVNHTVSGHTHSFSDFTITSGGSIVSTPASSDWSLALLAFSGLVLAVGFARRVLEA